MPLTFSSISRRDVAAALTLSEEAGWGMREVDWERLVTLPQVVTVGGWDGDRLVATATAVTYGRDVAWIGSIIVAESHRRQGVGTSLFEQVLTETEATDVAVIGLDANDTGKPIYARAGFCDVLPATVLTGTPARALAAPDIEPLDDVSRIASYDAHHVGVDREFLLASLFADWQTNGVVTADDTGYALYSRTRTGWAVGPLVADDDQTVTRLLAGIADVLDGAAVTVNALGPDATAVFRAAGLTESRTLTRMTYPTAERVLVGPTVYANAGFALG